MEIERKFRLAAPPPIRLDQGVLIAQGYFPVDRGELRLRRKGQEYFLTVKGEGTVAREEWETPVPSWVFDQLWPATEGAQIEKTRHEVLFEGRRLELDLYRGALEGLVILECEFPDAGQAAAFRLPDWAADALDVTSDPVYKNKNLARFGVGAR